MIALLPTVLVASLLGSLHCAGMCGALATFACGEPTDDGGSRSRPVVAYNLGRLAGYLILGIVAGILGHALDLGAGAVGLPRAAAVLAGSLMIAFGVVAILRARGIRVSNMGMPASLKRAVAAGHRLARSLEPTPRAATIGGLTALLPCGWLYAFVVTAAGTGSPLAGAAVMGAFWLGTVPVLAGLGLGARALSARLGAKLPVATALIMVALGLWTVAGRLAMPSMAPATAPADVAAAAVPGDHTTLPCCAPDAN